MTTKHRVHCCLHGLPEIWNWNNFGGMGPENKLFSKFSWGNKITYELQNAKYFPSIDGKVDTTYKSVMWRSYRTSRSPKSVLFYRCLQIRKEHMYSVKKVNWQHYIVCKLANITSCATEPWYFHLKQQSNEINLKNLQPSQGSTQQYM